MLSKQNICTISVLKYVLNYTHWMKFLLGVPWALEGGDAGEDGAVLELEDVLLDETFGVVVEELPELIVELESDDGSALGVADGGKLFGWGTTFFEWSVGIRGVPLSSDVGVGGATLDGPGWTLKLIQLCNEFLFWIIKYNYPYFIESFMSDLAKLFNSTKASGKIPIFPSNFPSAQFSSTLLITLIMSPFLKTRQPSSSSFVIRKS